MAVLFGKTQISRTECIQEYQGTHRSNIRKICLFFSSSQ